MYIAPPVSFTVLLKHILDVSCMSLGILFFAVQNFATFIFFFFFLLTPGKQVPCIKPTFPGVPFLTCPLSDGRSRAAWCLSSLVTAYALGFRVIMAYSK